MNIFARDWFSQILMCFRGQSPKLVLPVFCLNLGLYTQLVNPSAAREESSPELALFLFPLHGDTVSWKSAQLKLTSCSQAYHCDLLFILDTKFNICFGLS